MQKPGRPSQFLLFLTLFAVFLPAAHAQHRTNQCETVLVFETGMTDSGAALPAAAVDPRFRGISANFSNTPNAYVVSNVPGAWISNSVSVESKWIAPAANPNYPAGTYQYQLTFVTPCTNARVNGRFAAGDRGAVRLNGAGAFISTPATGYTNWTGFAFSGLPAGTNRLDFYATNAPGAVGPPGPTGLRAELEVTATCCPCIVLNCPNNIVATTCSNSAVVNYTVTGTNRCFTNLNIVCTPPSGSSFPPGNTLVNCDASDTVGHRTNCTFTVTVIQSNTPPVIQCPTNFTLTAHPITCRAILTQIPVTATDDCSSSSSISISQNPGPGAPLSIGQHPITIIATDQGGLRSTCTVTVAVCDNIAPVLQCPPGIFLGCRSGGTNVLFKVQAQDNCDPAPVITCNPPSGSFFPPGTNMVVCTARDQCNNVSTCSFNVVITSEPYTMTLQGGIADNFFNPEPASASACLMQSGVWAAKPFDSFSPTTKAFAHSFQNLPAGISGAKLTLYMKPRSPFSSGDILRIGLTGCSAPGTWAFQAPVASLSGANGTWTTNPPTTFVLDLAALPGGGDLLPDLTSDLRLDFAVGNYTAVDYARLELKYCEPSGVAAGIPFIVTGAQPVFRATGISFDPLQRNVPYDIEWDLGFGDGIEWDFNDGFPFEPICSPISTYEGLSTDWPTGLGTTATLQIASAPAQGQTLLSMHQPSNTSGKAIEVWNNGQLVSRYFLAGTGDTKATANGCLMSMGFSTVYFFANFSEATPITILTGNHISGQVGPVVNGDQLRLYFNVKVAAPTPKRVRFTGLQGSFDAAHVRIEHEGTRFEGVGNDGLTLSDVHIWKNFGDLFAPFGTCTWAGAPFWELNLNGVVDFCHFNSPQPPQCDEGWLDVNMYGVGPPKYFVGGLRFMPTALPLDDCEISIHQLPGPFSVAITPSGGGTNIILAGVSNVLSTHWPTKVKGNASPNTWNVELPPNTTITAKGQNYSASAVTFLANVTALDQFYTVCLEATKLQQFSFKSLVFTPTNPPAECVTISCPTNILANCDSNGTAVVNYTVGAASRCGSNVTVVCTPPSGSVFPPGVSFVDCVATDETGNQDRCRFTVTIRDVAPPRPAGPRRIIAPCEGPAGAVVYFDASATDDCDPEPTVSCNPPSGTLFAVGTNTVTCTAVDADGNRNVFSFPVIVLGGCGNDRCIEITVPASNVVARCTSSNGAVVAFSASARNGCTGGQLSLICDPPSGSVFPVGLTQVICTSSNGASWGASSFLVEVTDDTPPTITCPSNITMQAQSPLGAVVRYTATGTDDCSPRVRLKCSPPSGSVFPVGSTIVMCEASDGHGNVSHCRFIVTVTPPRPMRIASMLSNRFEVRWSGDAILEGTPSLGDDANWQPIPGIPASNDTDRVLQVTPSEPMQFFRIRPLPLLPPPDSDGDGVPDFRDLCPDTPAGLFVDTNGCALLQFLGEPETVFEPSRLVLSNIVRQLELAGLSNAAAPLKYEATSRLTLIPISLREHQVFDAYLQHSNLMVTLRATLFDFLQQKPGRIAALLRQAPHGDAEHADVRLEDWEIMRLDEIESHLNAALALHEGMLASLSNIVLAAANVRPRERVTIQSFDLQRGAARLTDGRLLLMPAVQEDAAPPLDTLGHVLGAGSQLDIDASQMADGSLLGQSAASAQGVDSMPVVAVDPRCLRLRIVPADPALPDFDGGTRHNILGYQWDINAGTTRLQLEYGAAFAAQKVICNAEKPGAYHHWLGLLVDHDNDGDFNSIVTSLTDTSRVWVLKPTSVLPSGIAMPLLVREFRAPVLTNGTLGTAEVIAEDTYVLKMNEFAEYARASYSRHFFELPDSPNYSGFQSAQVVSILRDFPMSLQSINQQTFTALSYKVNGNISTYPNVESVHLNESFAVHNHDPNYDLFFSYSNDVRRALYGPTLRGFNHGKPFTYRVELPKIVRDRLHDCSTDSFYRIPFIGILPSNLDPVHIIGKWSVSQGNNGSFTHKGWDKYAFDFLKPLGFSIYAARGGVVEDIRTTGCFSCWNPNYDNGDGTTGACVTGDCQGQFAPNFVKIKHQDGTVARYLHFKKNGVKVSKSQKIYRGDYLGDVGTTGCSTATHLHFDVLNEAQDTSLPVRFEAYDSDFDFRECYLPPSNSNGWSTNEPWDWPF